MPGRILKPTSGQAAGQASAPAIPNYQTPTHSSLAHQSGPVTRDDVDMLEPAPLGEPATGDRDQEMADVPPPAHLATPPIPVAPVPPSAAPVLTTPAPVPASANQPLHVGSLLQNLPSAPLSRGELTRLRIAEIRTRAEAAKRRRTEATDDSADNQPSAAKKQQTEKPGDVQERAVVRQPFPYTEASNTRRTFCCLRVNGSPIIGSLQRQNGWGIYFSLDAGSYGVHTFHIDLLYNVVDKSIPLKDASSVPGELNIIPMAWYTGAREDADSNEGPYQLEDFEILCSQDHPGHQAANDRLVWEACPESKRRHLAYCRFKSNKTYYIDELAGGKPWTGVDVNFIHVFKRLMRGKGNYVEIWFLHPFGSSSSFEEKVLMPFRRAYEERLPILSQYNVLDLEGTPSIKDIGQGMYCQYPMKSVPGSKKKVQDQSEGPIGFRTLPTPKVYNFRRDFEIYHALIPIRESQYQKGLALHVEMNAVRVYLMSLTGIEVKDRAQFEEMTPAQQRFHKTFYAFIRMPGQKGQKGLVPMLGLRVQLEWDNSDPQRQKAHAPLKNSQRWKGIVISHQGPTVIATETDYCVLLTMPDTLSRVPFRPFSEPKYLPNRQLPLAHLKVKYCSLACQRELEAWLAFCNSRKPQLMAMQRVLRSNAYLNDTDVPLIDVSAGPFGSDENKRRFNVLVDRFERDNALDPSQIQAVRRAALAPTGTRILQGPPGTGKTWTAAHLTWAFINAGHTVLFVAPTNVSVDSATTALMRSRPADMAHHKVIRLECTSLSMGEITKYIDYDEMERHDQPGIVKPLPAPEDDPVLQSIIEEFEASLDVQADVDFEKFEAETKNFEKAYELTLNAYRARIQDYPVEASLDFNVWRTCKGDFDRAASRMRNVQLVSPNITELITSEETESSEYPKVVQNYIHLQGKLSSAAAITFMKLRIQQEARNISEASLICTTCSNAAADIVAAKFNPTVIILDDGGQMTAPAMAVPLMAFKHWIASYSFGDPQQLQPLINSVSFCEVKGIVDKSVLGTYIHRNYPVLSLKKQYCMDPELALFPSQVFYDGRLRNAASTEIDSVYKQAIRRVTSKYYGIKGKDGNGSLYMMVDVVHGRARLEERGTSLQNYANAEAVIQAIRYLIDEGFPRSEIKLLTLYNGQKTILVSRLVEGPEGDHWVPSDVATVDSYQRKRAVFACLDMVAAYPVTEGKMLATVNEEDADAPNAGKFLNVEAASSHVTNPHRLCVAMTRATCGLFTFCQTATLVGAYKPSRSDYQNALFKMVENAQERGLIYRDRVHFDTHPAALKEVAHLDAFNTRMQQERQDEQQLLFVENVLRKARTQRHVPEQEGTRIPEPRLTAPTSSRRAPYALPKRPTTRSLYPEPTPTTHELDYGDVALSIGPPTQRDLENEKNDLRDKALLAQLEEEEKRQRKKPQTIPYPRMVEGSGAVRTQDASEEREEGEISDDAME